MQESADGWDFRSNSEALVWLCKIYQGSRPPFSNFSKDQNENGNGKLGAKSNRSFANLFLANAKDQSNCLHSGGSVADQIVTVTCGVKKMPSTLSWKKKFPSLTPYFGWSEFCMAATLRGYGRTFYAGR